MPRSLVYANSEHRPPTNDGPKPYRLRRKTEDSIIAREAALEYVDALARGRKGILGFTCFTMPTYEVNWHHLVMAKAINRFVRGETPRLILALPPRFGKALQVDTPIPTPDGFTPIGNLRPGDWVFDENGAPCRVVARSRIWKDRPVFAVTTRGSEPILADAEHEWLVQLCRKHKKFAIKTSAYLAARGAARPASIKVQGALQLPDKVLPIDPYVLGVWLGDGSSSHATISAHDDDAPFYRQEFLARGYPTSNRKTRQSFGVLGGFWAQVGFVGLRRNKHIPAPYLRAAKWQRLELLQGLIDTDGHVANGGAVEFCTTNNNLAQGVYELVCSLGAKVTVQAGRAKLYGKDCGPKWRVFFFLKDCALIPRKRSRTRSNEKFVHRQVKIDACGVADTCCIQVDSLNSMFLAGTSMLPTHNSELISRRLPAYLLGRNPDEQIISCSYSADLSSRMNRDVQRVMDEPSYQALFPKTRLNNSNVRTAAHGNYLRNSDMFEVVGHKGVYKSSGVGGPITGAGMKTGIVDDPIKNAEEASSQLMRDRIWEWFGSTFYTRLEKDARICVVMTRWHMDDLVGRLLAQAEADPTAEQWTVVNLPAVNETGPTEIDPRQPGDPLWPNKYPSERMAIMRKTVGERVWASLYQQRPAPMGGNVVKDAWWKFYPSVPTDLDSVVISADLTFKDGQKTDFSVFQVWGSKQADRYLLAQVRERMGFNDQEKALLALESRFPQATAIYVEEAANGAALIDRLRSRIGRLVAVRPRGSKVARAEAIAPQIEAGNVYLPDPKVAPWILNFTHEWSVFPNGEHDDQVDACSQALHKLARKRNVDQMNFISMERESPFL